MVVHAREDYEQKTAFSYNAFPDEHEPVFVLRGRDMLMGDVVAEWLDSYVAVAAQQGIEETEEVQEHITHIKKFIDYIDAWQATYRDKVHFPDNDGPWTDLDLHLNLLESNES